MEIKVNSLENKIMKRRFIVILTEYSYQFLQTSVSSYILKIFKEKLLNFLNHVHV